MKKMTLKDADLKGKRLLMRVDFNVPLDSEQSITDDKRIRAALPSIQYAVERGARLILMSHLGRPKGSRIPEMSLKPVADKLGDLLGQSVAFADDCVGEAVKAKVNSLQDGDVLLLENLRFHKAETENDADFAAQIAELGDLYANDAFGTAHRAHASTVGVAEKFKTRLSGFLMEKELDYLGGALSEPKTPFVAILGGAKIADKIPVIEQLIDKVDKLLIGGGMMFTFIKARGGQIGASMLDADNLAFAKKIQETHDDKIVLPKDCLISDKFDFKARELGEVKTVASDEIPDGWLGLDIGPEALAEFSDICKAAGTIVWNGPMGVFEIPVTAKGTLDLAKALAVATKAGAVTIIGGGDSASAVKKAGVAADMSHVSTGGGASLEFLQGKTLPGVHVLTDKGE